MPTPHINAKENDFSNVVLMPGDPKRAEWMAKTFLTDYKLVTDVRGMLGFTGYTKNGKRLSIMASGMGQPSIGIYSYELYSHYGVDTIIRVGTCGSYQPDIKLFDVLIASTASTDSNWGNQFNLYGTYSAGSDFELTKTAYECAQKLNMKVRVGNVLSADVFYDNDPENWKKWQALGVLGVEMESYALYCNATKLHKRALCMLTVSDSYTEKDKKATIEERQTSLSRMIECAILTAEQYIK